ncbi:MAG: hypothetical protein Q4G34_07520 [Micrococcus sp.]|nr:hypothetical protein [Micrococcus sp.]
MGRQRAVVNLDDAAATVADWALSRRGLERLELGHRDNTPPLSDPDEITTAGHLR